MAFFSKKRKPFSQEVGVFEEKPRLQYLLPWAYVDEDTGIVHGKDHSMLAVYEFRGPDMDSSTYLDLMQYNAAVNNVIKKLPTGYVLYFEAQRGISKEYQESRLDVPLVQKMEDERKAYYAGQKHFETRYYFIVYLEPPQLLKHKLTDLFISDKQKDGKTDMRLYVGIVEKFINNVNLIGDMLHSWFPDIHPLNAEEALTYLHSTISTKKQVVKVNPLNYISEYICDCGVLGGREMMLGDRYIKMITILDFPPVSTPGAFDRLNNLDIEYRWVSRFICMSKVDAQKELKDYRQRWNQQIKSFWTQVREAILKEKREDERDETAMYNKDDASAALQELGQDYTSYGYYTMTVMVSDEDQGKCLEKANRILESINSLGYTAYIETDNSMESWWGSIPGCYRANIRRPIVSSLNFCHLAPVTATWSGDKRNECLKGPVLLYTDTTGYTPFRLSLHVGDVGHTLICGRTGSGKSVLLNTLEVHFLKYPNSNVFIFDKAASSRALTLAVGGNFYNIASEGSGELSFQPLAHVEDEKETKWAKEWILGYLNLKNITITPAKDNFVWKALLSLREFPKEQRTISTFCEMVQDQEIRQALAALTVKGAYGKLFDNNKDISGIGRWQVFEMETLMATPAIVPSTLEYLFHRIETKLQKASGPSLIIMDEAWLFFDNPMFKEKIKEYFKDMRKKNTSIILATQNLTDLSAKPELLSAVLNNCPNKIYLSDKEAKTEKSQEIYRMFGCNEKQMDIIANMEPKRDYYYSSEKGNRIFRLALQPIELPFVTATAKKDQQAMDSILQSAGRESFIEEWLKYKDCQDEWEDYRENYL